MINPSSLDELATAIRETDGPLVLQGGGTRDIGRVVEGEPLSVAKMTGITLYDPGSLTLVAQAGTPLSEIETALAADKQRLAFEPMDHRTLLGTTGTPTIGGIVAANVSGPRRISVGAARDFLLGVKFIDGRGQAISNGGRVMKNVTGYDLVKLMAGSWGTLGVLTEVSFKVLPQVEAELTLVISGLDAAQSVAAMSAALGSPYEVSGVARRVSGDTLLRLEGFTDSVAYRAAALSEALAPFGEAVVLEASESREHWAAIRDVRDLAGIQGDVWRLSVKPSDAPGLMTRLGVDKAQYDWGGGLIWAVTEDGRDLRAEMDVPGHATLIRASDATRAAIAPFHPEPAPLAAIAKGLRDRFDPRSILNPSRML